MQELEKILEEINKEIKSSIAFSSVFTDGLCRARNIIRKHMNDGWIPVDERLPKRDGFYLVSINIPTNIEEIKVSKVWFGENENAFSEYGKAIIAWRPLPEPYRPERSDNHDRE